ncbi:MFS transporter [Alicyclobacillus dauci]|uniref:MFS transporter n=1 Tax=Alicyclobacillus dauci TaxID=1475485 RepID=A0ABY6Z4A2_9BACL|nr:MFS transporter [Alicyclobacillus dauci]WAH37718.1 MFS transporter [Alicyclobacillus dauci]
MSDTQIQASNSASLPRPSAYRWVVLSVTTISQTGTSFISQGVAAVIPFLVLQLKLNNTQVALTVSAVNIGMALTAILFGQLVDRVGEKKVLVGGGVMTGFSVFAASLANSFALLLGLLLITGLWAASSTPAGSKAIMSWFPYSMRAFAIGIRQTGVAGGGFLAALILPAIASRYNWRDAFMTASIAAVAVSFVCWFVYREDTTRERKQPKGDDPPRKHSNIHSLFRNRSLWYISVGTTAYMGAQFVLLGYTQLFLHDNVNISIHWSAFVLALTLLAGVFGRVLWGIISDRFFSGARKPVMLLIGVIMAIASLAMLLVHRGLPVWLVTVLFCCFGFSAIGWNGVWVTFVSELVGKEQSGTAVGLGMTVLQMGVLGFPLLFGSLIDRFHSYNVSWVVLFAIVCLGILTISRVREKTST